MLIRSLTFRDFLTFSGEQTLNFPSAQDASVSVILGANNSGKSNIIRGLRFLLYGEERSTQKGYPGFQKISTMKDGEDGICSVEAVIEKGQERTQIKRTIKFAKADEGPLAITVYDSELEVLNMGRINTPISGTAWESRVNKYVPKEMFDFYFFRGEELAETLLQQTPAGNIPKLLADTLYKSEWSRISATLSKVKTGFNRDLVRKKGIEEAYKAKFLAIEADAKEEGKMRDELSTLSSSLTAPQQSLKELKKKILDMESQSNPSRKDELKAVDRHLDSATNDIKRLHKQNLELLGKKSCVALFEPFSSRVQTILGDLKKSDSLPPAVKESLLGRILEIEHVCICGTPCPPESPEHARLSELRASTMKEPSGEMLTDIWNLLQPHSNVGWIQQSADVQEKLSSIAGLQREKFEEVGKLADEKAEIEEQVDDSKEDELLGYRQERLKLEERIKTTKDKIRTGSERLDQQLERTKRNRRDLGGLRSQAEGVTHLVNAIEICEKFIGVAGRISSSIDAMILRELTMSLKETYEKITSDGSEIVVARDTFLPSITRGGIKVMHTGGGQTQVMLLCYINALSRIRRKINQELSSTFAVKELDDQTFFMDSVFGSMQPSYVEGVSEELRKDIPQLVMLFAAQQWKSEVGSETASYVEDAFGEAIGSVYGLEHSTSDSEDCKPKDFVFEYSGQEFNLLKPLPAGEQARTRIVKIR